MEASQHSLLAACFTLHSINTTLAIVPQRGAGPWIARLFGNNARVKLTEPIEEADFKTVLIKANGLNRKKVKTVSVKIK
jgi:hypothetical protein